MTGPEFKKLLKEAGVTQAKLARITTFTPKAINNWANKGNAPQPVILLLQIFALIQNMKQERNV